MLERMLMENSEGVAFRDAYERSMTEVSCAVGQTWWWWGYIKDLGPFLFAMVMDWLTDEEMMSVESREQVEEQLEKWRFALERKGMKVIVRQNTCVN